MATLTSPGVSVSVIDESAYPGRGNGTVPFILIATASNKSTPDGSGVAEGTLPSNANQLYLITSQRELLQTFGDPRFQQVGGTVQNGGPINEYGLLAAQSYLGLANQAYVIRADIDLAELEPTAFEPTGPAVAGTYWLDVGDADFGLHVLGPNPADPTETIWQKVTVNYFTFGIPDDTFGSVGEYAAVYNDITGEVTFYKFFDDVASFWQPIISMDNPADGGRVSKIAVGSVYPTSDIDSNSFDNFDVGYAYWVKTGTGSNSVDLALKLMGSDQQFANVATPAFLSEADAETFYGNNLAAGVAFTHVFASTGTLGGFDGSVYVIVKAYNGSTWDIIEYTASETAPVTAPVNGAYWFNPDVGLNANGQSTVDLLINNGTGSWLNVILPGYSSQYGDMSNVALYTQSLNPRDDVSIILNDKDIWLDTADLESYPALYRYKASNQRWIRIDVTDQDTPNGILFADARPTPTSRIDIVSPSTAYGLNNGGGTAPNLDQDAPDPDLYPAGTLLWNTRYSSRNVRQWDESYFVFRDTDGFDVFDGRWVNVSGNNVDGSPRMGEDAQRAVVTRKMGEVLIGNEEIRSDAITFNLIAAPGFPELIDEMVVLNVDRKETSFIIADTPFKLPATGTALQRWASNANNAAGNGQDGLITADPYVGVYYPSGLATNTDGTEVVVPASHMVLRTYGFNDQVAYPWFAPAGLQRGRVSNATSIGYVSASGEFVPVTLNEGLRSVLYQNNVNPITFIPGSGIVVYGQKTRNPFESAMDRVNVARLVNYIRERADRIARPFLFQPNDQQTRDGVLDTFDRFLAELVTLRGLQDFLVVCDTSNNTPLRIDRNELWIDIAIQPTKAIEFIYIPIRIRNTGESLN